MAGEDLRRIERRIGQRVLIREVERVIDPRISGELLARDPRPITVLRPTDLLLVRFSFQNLRWVEAERGGWALARRAANRAAFLIADFPPQHLVEEAFAQREVHQELVVKPELPIGTNIAEADKPKTPDNDDDVLTGPPVQASLSAHSRLVFKVGSETIRWSLDGLLDAMTRLPLSVAPHAENPFRIIVPFDQTILDTISKAANQRALAAHSARAVPAVIRAVGRSAAASRVLDHRLGRRVSAEITSTSRIAVELGISPAVLGRLRVPVHRPAPRAPTATETAIELPWRLQLSPHAAGGFTHAAEPVDHDGRVELWHSRLGNRATDDAGEAYVDEDDPDGRTVRAIWARDLQGPLAPTTFDATGALDTPNFTKSLTSNDRRMLVHETSNFTLTRNGRPWTPPAVDVDRLMLTTLGGWLRSDFDAPALPDGTYSITEWKHRATMGRDHEVKVVYAGFLFPFGHPASLVKITERKIQHHPTLPGRYAYLRQRFFIVVRQQTMTYPERPANEVWNDTRNYGRKGKKRLDLAMPFSSVNILTRITPDLDAPGMEAGPGPFCFFPSVDGTPFAFKILATDRENQIVEYGGPLMFVDRGRNIDAASLDTVTKAYWDAAAHKRQHRLGGQRVALAAATDPSNVPLDTTLAVDTVEFDAAVTKPMLDRQQDEPRFWPVLRSVDVVVPAMNALAGVATPTPMVQPLRYLENGLVDNQTHVFLEAATPAAMSFAQQADRSGGFVTPSLSVTGLSGSKGPIGGPIDDAIDGSMDPQKFFDGLDLPAKLFGAVKLSDLLKAIGLTPDNMPSFIADSVNQVTGFLEDLHRIVAIATDVENRFAAEADPAIQTVRNSLNTVQAHAQGVLAAFADVSSLAGAAAAIDTLAAELGTLAAAIDGATALPSALRVDSGGVVRRLTEYVEDTGAIVDAASQWLGGQGLPETISAKLSWSTQLAPWPDGGASLFQPRPKPGETEADARATLELGVEVQAPTKPGKDPTATVACSITPFSLRLLGSDFFIALAIDVIEFTLTPGRKPDVNVVFADPGIVFGGPLSFVNELQKYIPFDGFSDPPYLDVDAQGIKAGFDLPLPDLAIGVFSLANITLGAQANVPFIGDSLDFTFSFCTRENPFRLTVWLFGGGGFFAITVTPDRCRMLEAAFEFGAAVALDFGVASGSIECMAGVYFKLETSADGRDDGELAGYFRLRGEVDVLGLISASIELYLELSYEPPSGKAVGRASLTIEVEVLFLSFSVEISCEKKFKGSNQDPTFEQVMGLTPPGGLRPWDKYCNAFAAS